MRLFTAFRAFFATLGNLETANRIEAALNKDTAPKELESPKEQPIEKKPEPKPQPAKLRQSEAITFLAMLQREARFVDFLQESLDAYSDDQVGVAARSVHSECAKVVSRVFAIEPLLDITEQERIEITETDAARYQLVGNVGDRPPYHGTVMHPGWKAGKCELPKWNGNPEDALILAPAEIEI